MSPKGGNKQQSQKINGHLGDLGGNEEEGEMTTIITPKDSFVVDNVNYKIKY